MAYIRGKRTCACMAAWFPVMEKEAIRQGIVKRSVDIYQLIGNASASAGYHRSGAAADFKQASAAFVKLCRNMGAAAWRRDGSDGMIVHTHLALKGCPHLTAGARAQVGELERGGDGLVGSRRDRGPRTGVKFPLRTWQEGIDWAKAQGKPAPAPKPIDRMDPANYGPGKNGPHITWLGQRLVAHGFDDAYDIGPGPSWGPADKANVASFQKAHGLARTDGLPDKTTLELLAAEPQVTVPKAPAAEAAMFRLLNINVCADYCASSYSSRLDNIEAVRAAARASIVVTTESGNYDDGARLNRAFGWGGRRGVSYILHGASVPITTAIHWNPATYELTDEGQFETTGSTHRYATWVVLEHKQASREFVVGATHLIPWPKGPNTIRKYDIQREQSFGAFLDKLKRIAGTRPALGVGDLNGKRNDPYDGPGKAMTKHGFVEAKTGKAVIDRICGRGVTFTEHTVLPTRGATDHDTAVAAYVTLNK